MRLVQMIDHHIGALDRLRVHLREPKTAVQCFLPLFKRELTGDAYGMGLVEAVAHLNYLWHRGEISRVEGADGVLFWQIR